MDKAIIETNLDGVKLLHRGKVRDLYEIDDNLLIIATDRISAFDCVFPTGIPKKGEILTNISNKWFNLMNIAGNHIIETNADNFPEKLEKYKDTLKGRSVIVKKAERIDFECVVRGYIAGSAWKEYKADQTVCGISINPGLEEAEKLPFPIFTPATKADTGHDENVPFSHMVNALGKDISEELRRLSIQLFEKAHALLSKKGIILADTKFEFGLVDGKVILIDELLTPDSSRFWPADSYTTGSTPPGFDKQYVRDYVEELKWNKTPPAPELPDNVVAGTIKKYRQIEEIILSL
ncbi:MAG: phosphoribosylaminoimidazolesuccinocarboxamide synthase [Spirochaetes bacterium]|nr:phosphoribosylaminoimidazolesuccinocarboxamide synthase [Spirochaetota bacterium]